MKAPAVSRTTYALTFGALLALTLVTTLLGYLNLGPFNTFFAVGLAAVKAALIAGIFMHGLLESKLVKVVMAAGVFWFLVLVSLTLNDYFTRGWVPFPGK